MEDSSITCLLFLPGMRSQRMLICGSPLLEKGEGLKSPHDAGSSVAPHGPAKCKPERWLLGASCWGCSESLFVLRLKVFFLIRAHGFFTSKTWLSDICASGSRIVNPAALSIQNLQNDSSLLPHIRAPFSQQMRLSEGSPKHQVSGKVRTFHLIFAERLCRFFPLSFELRELLVPFCHLKLLGSYYLDLGSRSS